MARRHAAAALLVSAAFILAGCDLVRGYTEARGERIEAFESAGLAQAELGAVRFVFDDFHGLSTDTLETNALPWKVATTALLLADDAQAPPTRERLRERLTGFGFIWPERIANWPGPAQPHFDDAPLGLVTGVLQRRLPAIEVQVVNLGCASCHAGVLHDADGQPTREVWLGLPNTSLDLDAYVDAVFAALVALGDDPEPLLAAIPLLYPQTTTRELASIRRYVWPRLRERLPELERAGGALPFDNGGPGRSNGIDALKLRLDAKPASGSAATISIPILAGLPLRSSLLVDGLYGARGGERYGLRRDDAIDDPMRLAGIVGYFTVPSMGVDTARVAGMLPRVADTIAFLAAGQRTPRFPGTIDGDRAARGERLYESHCARCHGRYREVDGGLALSEFPNLPTASEAIGSDPARLDAVTPELVDAINASEIGRDQVAARGEGYVGTVLSGLWATAPYLHNGSVPTLWHLMRPSSRPLRFQVGGHRLDHQRVGIAGVVDGNGDWRAPSDHVPWSTPAWTDTRRPGHGNGGHAAPFDRLDDAARDDLLEYLKRL